jgi:site-specific DNA-adenine methylase
MNQNIKLSSKDYFDLKPNKGDVVYLDPPYLITEAGYNAYWSKEHEERLYTYLDELNDVGAYFLLSNVAEHKGVVNPYLDRLDKFNIIELDFNYDKVSKKGKSKSKEILVKNF